MFMCDLTASSIALVLERCFSSEDGAGREAIIKGRSNVTWCKSIDILLQNIFGVVALQKVFFKTKNFKPLVANILSPCPCGIYVGD